VSRAFAFNSMFYPDFIRKRDTFSRKARNTKPKRTIFATINSFNSVVFTAIIV